MLGFIIAILEIDPVTLGSPMLTSIMNLLGVIIYFGFAYILANLLIPTNV